MNKQELSRPETIDEQDWLRHLQWLAAMGSRASENYAAHLARVTPDADRNKALLQACYRALRAAVESRADPRQPGQD